MLSWIPRRYKQKLKSGLFKAQMAFVRALLSYDSAQLLASLRALGIRQGDSVMLHSAFGPLNGFRGPVGGAIDVFSEAVGPSGNLLMVSLPYRSSTFEYLKQLEVFDVSKAPSMMGWISESFRRRPGVLRSLHPTHPVLAQGAEAPWFVAGHESCRYPCGPGTPFEKLAAADGKVVFFNVEFDNFTFFHFLEHSVRAQMPYPLYVDEPFDVKVIDADGHARTVTTFAFSPEAIRRRRVRTLETELRRRRLIREQRVGNSRLMSVRVRDVVDCVEDMSRKGQYFFDLTGLARP